MEVYFKELISKEASLDKLVDDLERVVQGADDFAQAIGANAAEYPRTEVVRRLQQLKDGCRRINSQIVSKARATDKLVREKPYAFLGAAAVLGVFLGVRLGRGGQ